MKITLGSNTVKACDLTDFMITKEAKKEFKQLVQRDLINFYNMKDEEAYKAINNSSLTKMIDTAPEWTMHYSSRDWAKDIYHELNGLEPWI